LVPFEAQGLAARLPVYRSNWTIRAGVRARQAVAHIVRSTRLDALFFHTQVPAVLAADWMKRIPSVVSLDATPLQYDSLGQVYAHASGPAWLEHLKWRLNRDCFRAARHIVTWSQWAKQGLIDDYEVPADKITVIPPGVNATAWYRSTPRQILDEPVKILFVGGDFERKGGLLLLEAFRALRPLGIELHVVTKAPLPTEPDLFVYTNMRPNSDELKALYHRCDIFCLPTYGDCLPMVLTEAGAAGLPAISTRVAGIPEIIRDNETGRLVAVGDVVALTEVLKELILSPEVRLRQGAQAADVVSRDFDAVQNTSRLVALLKQMSQK
jgi:glycosyltransferase involved in cell wall biosynthesis